MITPVFCCFYFLGPIITFKTHGISRIKFPINASHCAFARFIRTVFCSSVIYLFRVFKNFRQFFFNFIFFFITVVNIIDIKNQTTIGQIQRIYGFGNEEQYFGFYNILGYGKTCFVVWNEIRLYVGDYYTNAWCENFYDVPPYGNLNDIIGIYDYDLDGKDEIIMFYRDYSDDTIKIGIWGDGTTVNTDTNTNPSSFSLKQNYPNPFNPTTSIDYQVQLNGDVILSIYDLFGKRIKTLVNGKKPVGDYNIKWDGTNDSGTKISSGQYFYQLKVDLISIEVNLGNL